MSNSICAGGVVAGVVGCGLLRYSLFGETVDIAIKMRNSGLGKLGNSTINND